jgi:hypothetical protein
MNEINYLRKQAGLPLLAEVSDADITRALTEVQARMTAGQLDESVYSTLKAILATVGQKGSKAGKAAAEKAKKLPGTIRALYKETENKEQLRLLYRQFTVMLNTLDKIDSGTKNLQDKDPDIKREIDLFQRLISRITVDLQARAGASVAVAEAFSEDELSALMEVFLAEEKVLQLDGEGTTEPGGYSIDGQEYRSDEAEALVDEAKQMAASTGKKWEDVLLKLVPEEQLKEDTYVGAAEFSDDFYSLLDSLKTAARTVGAKRGKLRRWLRKADFANSTQADELFDVFLNKFHDAMVALRSADKQLQKKL